MNKRFLNYLHVIRRIVQILSFLLIPGLFSITFGAVRILFTNALAGTFIWDNISNAVWTLATTIPATLIFGRVFCGFFCSFGAMGDFLWFLSSRLFKRKLRISSKADKLLKYLKYVILIFIVAFSWTGHINLGKYDPWAVYGRLTNFKHLPAAKEIFTIAGLLLLLIMIGSLFIERFFCRYLCPMGAIYAILSKCHLVPIQKPRKNCGSCHLCTMRCSMGISLGETDIIRSQDCIKCMRCEEVCPKGNAKEKPTGIILISVIMTAILIGACTFVGKTTSQSSGSIGAITTKGKYKDGTYVGDGTGYRGTTKVKVTVKNGNITKLEILQSEDDDNYLSTAKNVIFKEVLKEQTGNVDAATGATFSSNGIITAVKHALGEEVNEKIQNKVTNDPNVPAEGTTEKKNLKGFEDLINGSFYGIGRGFRGDVEVYVVVKGEKVTSIKTRWYYDDDKFFNKAEPVIFDEIIKQQTLNVDAVSGATYSSNGLIEAVGNALRIPKSDYALHKGANLSSMHGDHGHVVKKYK